MGPENLLLHNVKGNSRKKSTFSTCGIYQSVVTIFWEFIQEKQLNLLSSKNSVLYGIFTCLLPSHHQSSTIALKTRNPVTITVAKKTSILEVTGRGRMDLKLSKNLMCREMSLSNSSGRFMETLICSLVFILPDEEFIHYKENAFCL